MPTSQKHPVIEVHLPGIGKRCKALTIGMDESVLVPYVLVSYADCTMKEYAIYNFRGYKALPLTFTSLQDAIVVAEWFEQTYQEFLPIWEEFERANLPQLAQWTIKNGIKIYNSIQKHLNPVYAANS